MRDVHGKYYSIPDIKMALTSEERFGLSYLIRDLVGSLPAFTTDLVVEAGRLLTPYFYCRA